MKDQHQIFFNVEVAGSLVLPHETDLVIFVQFLDNVNKTMEWFSGLHNWKQ